ncbi:MAG: phage tail tape measure protein [Mailhella sp.]|nr:phage tail tape measure protein [Mailhella sp.]
MRKYGSSVKESERALEKLGKRLDRLNKADAVVKSLSNTVKNAQIGSAITFAGLGNVVSAGMDFEASMSRVGAVSGADPEQMKAMTDQARKLGAETVWSATQAAEGMQFLAMAGFKTEEILKTMPGMLDLASAGAIDLGRAADIASNILTGFGLEAEQMGRVGDILTNTFTTSNVDLEMLGQKVFLRAELPMECSRAETDPAFSSICFWHP